MLYNGITGTYLARADLKGRGHFGQLSTPRHTSQMDTAASNLAPPLSAFSTRSNIRSPSSAMSLASYGSPPSRHMMMKQSVQMHRSSPTSVMSPMSFDGGICGVPHEDANHFSPEYRHRASPVVHPVSQDYATPIASYIHAREIHFESLVQDTTAICLPCKPKLATPKSTEFIKFNSNSSAPGSNCRSSNDGPNISNGGDEERTPLSGGGRGIQPTPQNLRDNPERQAKVKTEMCQYYVEGGAKNCPWGANCNYAHGKHELKFRNTTLCRMESSGQIANAKTYLARPCMTWVSTGACPFGRRCAAMHDPSIESPLEYPSWLPAASAKTNAQIIVDRLAAHRESAVHQENPLIPQSIWENCRPSHTGCHQKNAEGGSNKGNKEQEWRDTYTLVCNMGVSAFSGATNHVITPFKKLSSLQKLCIAHRMRTEDGLSQQESSSQLHRDYVFAPTHSLQSELCMILQDRYFALLDVNFASADGVSPDDVVREISFDEYQSRTTPWAGLHFDPSKCITAHEVAFAPKGDHSANVSIWFGVNLIKLEQSQIKRSRRLKQKKKAQIRNSNTHPNANGALISRTSAADFPTRPPDIEPFVTMLPAEDSQESHSIINGMISHRIDSIILHNCSFVNEEQKKELLVRWKELKETFMGMAKFHKNWTWPKREGMENISITTKAPPGNVMPYIPLKSNKKSPCLHWHTFVKTISNQSSPNDDSKRLKFFSSLDGSFPHTTKGEKARLPHIISKLSPPSNATTRSLKRDGTWREILLGLPENDGMWEAALRLHNKKKEGSIDSKTKSRNLPLSTIPFVQA